MLAKSVNDNAGILNARSVLEFFASMRAPTFLPAKKPIFAAESILPMVSLLSFVTIDCCCVLSPWIGWIQFAAEKRQTAPRSG